MTTQQTKWGPEIPVNGKRPEWLGDADATLVLWDSGTLSVEGAWSPYRLDEELRKGNGGWSKVSAIRLLADHPYYVEVPCNSKAPTPSPELTARMVAHLLDCGEAFGIRPTQPEAKRRYDEMKAIVAELRAELEPVDGDLEEAERIAYDMEGALPRDLVEAGIKAGRKMEADERNAAIKRKWDDAHGSGAIAGRALPEAGK